MQVWDYTQEEFLKRFGARCRQLRKELGYSSADTFAFENGINRTQWSEYERGEVDLKLTTLMRIFKLLKTSPAIFFSQGYE